MLRILFQCKHSLTDQGKKKKTNPCSPAQFLTASTRWQETAGRVLKDTARKIYQAGCHPVTPAALLLPPRPCRHVTAPAEPSGNRGQPSCLTAPRGNAPTPESQQQKQHHRTSARSLSWRGGDLLWVLTNHRTAGQGLEETSGDHLVQPPKISGKKATRENWTETLRDPPRVMQRLRDPSENTSHPAGDGWRRWHETGGTLKRKTNYLTCP